MNELNSLWVQCEELWSKYTAKFQQHHNHPHFRHHNHQQQLHLDATEEMLHAAQEATIYMNGQVRGQSQGQSPHVQSIWDDNSGDDDADVSCRARPTGLCQVCGDKAGGRYFNAVVCIPCKAFYLRMALDASGQSEPCEMGGCCPITPTSRSCRYCRYQRCLAVGMCRRERPVPVLSEDGRRTCLVCGDTANGLHFGVQTCEGCKKFFRRAVREGPRYSCKGNGDCEVSLRTRNACRYCRYHKCLNIGMSLRAVHIGRPTRLLSAPYKHTYTRSRAHSSRCNLLPKFRSGGVGGGRGGRRQQLMSLPSNRTTTPLLSPSSHHHQFLNQTITSDFDLVTVSDMPPLIPYPDSLWTPASTCSRPTIDTEAEAGATLPDGSFLAQHSPSPSQGFESTTGLLVKNRYQQQTSENFGHTLPHTGRFATVTTATTLSSTISRVDSNSTGSSSGSNNEWVRPKSRSLSVSSSISNRSNNSDTQDSFTAFTCNSEFSDVCWASNNVNTLATDVETAENLSMIPFDATAVAGATSIQNINNAHLHLRLNCTNELANSQHHLLRLMQKSTAAYDKYRLCVEKVNRDSKDLINQVCSNYGEENQQSTAEMWIITKRYIKASCRYISGLPGFNKLRQEDQLTLLKHGEGPALIILSSTQWYNAKTRTFRADFYVNIPSPDRPDYDSYLKWLALASKLQSLSLDICESSLFTPCVIFATDVPGLMDVECVDNIRSSLLAALDSYITAKRGVKCRLMEALVGLISDVRHVAAERLRSTHMFLSPEPLTKHEEEEEGKDDFDLDMS